MVTSRWRCIKSAVVLKVFLDIQPVNHESGSDLDIAWLMLDGICCLGDVIYRLLFGLDCRRSGGTWK